MAYEDEEMVLDRVSGVRPSPSGWVYVQCPFCEYNGDPSPKKSLSYSPDTGYYQCWRIKCAVTGFVRIVGYERKTVPTVPVDPEILKPPDEFIPLSKPPNDVDLFRLSYYTKYLAGRGVTRECIAEANLGACLSGKYRGHVIVPVTRDDIPRGFVARTIVGKGFNNVPGFKREWMLNSDALWIDTDWPVAIVEGPFDALPHWPHAVAVLGQPTQAQFDAIATAKRPIVCLLDGDAHRKGDAMAKRLRLRGLDARFVRVEPGSDPGKMSHDQFLEVTGIGKFL